MLNMLLPLRSSFCPHVMRRLCTQTTTVIQQHQQPVSGQPDKLYRMIEIEVRGHDREVLSSYETFATTAAKELDITVHQTWEPWRNIERKTHLLSVFVKKRAQTQYEWRTHFRIMQFKYLTGSTADTFLEYIERNLPEGVSMRVAKHQLEPLPDHIQPPEPDNEIVDEDDMSSESDSSSDSDSDRPDVRQEDKQKTEQ